jgi:hypothetical protein
MKKLCVLLVVLPLLTNCKNINSKKRVFDNVTNNIQQGELVGKALSSIIEIQKELGLKLEFDTVEVVVVDIDGDNNDDIICVEKIRKWGDPGDFHKVTIDFHGNKDKIVFFNVEGWVRVGEYELQFMDSATKKFFDKSKYLAIQKLSNKDTLLFCFGYVYASQPGVLSVINLTRFEKPMLIMNYNYHLCSIKDSNNSDYGNIKVSKEANAEIEEYQLLNGWFSPLAERSE